MTHLFRVWPVNLAELGDEPALYVVSREWGISFVPSANPLSLSLRQRLAPSLPLENPTCPKLKYIPHHVLTYGYDVIIPVPLTPWNT